MNPGCENCRYDGFLYNYYRCRRCLVDLQETGVRTKWMPLLWIQRVYRKVINRFRKWG